ncbi:MAG TPA: AAA family ATPase [Candidatus Saccharimonadales bacterium]|nr:AAA family ATPase [Candidatus Saccharimonadales bacterium]
MTELILHTSTQQKINSLKIKSPHALLLVGPAGIGKGSVATYIAETLLNLKRGEAEHYTYFRRIVPTDKNSIGIDEVREIEYALALKVPTTKHIARVIVIENAHLLTVEAQNALLKTLEEPPSDTVIILTASLEHNLLTTIRSRAQTLAIQKPTQEALRSYFTNQFSDDLIDQHIMLSGGLPGMLSALLNNDNEHPIVIALSKARELLQKNSYERLLMVDNLSKQKSFTYDICEILVHMADVALTKSSGPSFVKWKNVLTLAHNAQLQLLANAQPKLVLTHLMLEL